MDIEKEKQLFEVWVRKELNMPDQIEINWDAQWTKVAWKVWEARARIGRPLAATPVARIQPCLNGTGVIKIVAINGIVFSKKDEGKLLYLKE